MKYPLLIFIVNLMITLPAQAKTILLCLGQEESYYAKRHDTGPRYHLNQIMINEISSVGNPQFSKGYFNKFCSEPSKSPTLKLLKALTTGQRKIFDFKEEDGGIGVQYSMSTYNEFRLKSIKILIEYLAKIQIQASSPDCLEQNIPGLKEFYARYRYLEGEVGLSTLKGSKESLLKIYGSLENIDVILKKCKKTK
ncbi:hypothetical protein [Bacteriovorax sp. BAL6_X]|uniref:hypothetical protein n=1 Tax=Bacteriovorax sp. BAL6_X TaxID=1201290 RepID=UPI00058D4129|nr:hypothetical protein [Bacteriovorax sp. BAL6_X]